MPDLPALVPCHVPARAQRVRERLPDLGCSALVVTDLANIRYLTGFTGSNATLLVRDDDLVFITDSRYRIQADEQLEAAGVEATVRISNDRETPLAAATKGMTRIAVEADNITWAMQRRWEYQTLSWADIIPTEALILDLRAVKDEGEVSRLHRAASIADAALADVADQLHHGPTEIEFHRLLDDAMAEHGSEAPSFPTIVASGPNGAKPHARPSDRVIGSSGAGELVVIDFGATVDGYHSDMTRTLAIGELSETQQRMLSVVAESQRAGVAAVKPETPCADVDRACRDVIDDAGWGEHFSHGTGHGIGLVIHEYPRLSARSSDVLATNNCVTVEPGVYIEDHGGVRIEDCMVVTDDGCRTLSAFPR